MTRSKRKLRENIFPSAREDAATSRRKAGRYSGNAYRLAFTDTEFLLREELRPVRFQLELLTVTFRNVTSRAWPGDFVCMYWFTTGLRRAISRWPSP